MRQAVQFHRPEDPIHYHHLQGLERDEAGRVESAAFFREAGAYRIDLEPMRTPPPDTLPLTLLLQITASREKAGGVLELQGPGSSALSVGFPEKQVFTNAQVIFISFQPNGVARWQTRPIDLRATSDPVMRQGEIRLLLVELALPEPLWERIGQSGARLNQLHLPDPKNYGAYFNGAGTPVVRFTYDLSPDGFTLNLHEADPSLSLAIRGRRI